MRPDADNKNDTTEPQPTGQAPGPRTSPSPDLSQADSKLAGAPVPRHGRLGETELVDAVQSQLWEVQSCPRWTHSRGWGVLASNS